ncbi:MAG: carboxypeptidase regulatory-like domain-containing protein [Bacteroidetes bacterium]|nr:carboxypeptidase regulatory-like domain-containing protein [Bacteroidota bacterium]
MRKFLLLTIFFACVFSLSGLAQKNLTKGNAYFDRNMFKEAIPYFKTEMENGDTKSKEEATEKLADCYRLLGEFADAEIIYKKLVQRAKKNPNHVLNYALSLKASSKYQEASEEFKKYAQLKPEDPMGSVYIESCKLAQQWLDANIGNEVKNLEFINTEHSEFSAILYKKGIVFCSSRPGSKKKLISFDGGANNPSLDFYYVDLSVSKDSLRVTPFEAGKLSTYMHEGPAAFTTSGDTIYFTRTVKGERDPNKDVVVKVLQIMESHKTPEGWSEPASAFSFNSTKYSVAHPSISPDGKTIVFMSDMPGGKGATDIYKTEKQSDGNWSTPTNLGDKVNTFGHELFPFLYDSKTIYFSSDAHPGMGKLDVFQAKLVNDTWTSVTNLQPPINSIGDDFSFVMDRNYRQGLLSSDRFDSKGLEDVYAFSEFEPIKIIVDGGSFKIADNSMFDGLRYKLVDNTTKKDVSIPSKNGYYTFTPEQSKLYTISIRKDGFPYNKIDFDFTRNTTQSYLDLNIEPKSKSIYVEGILKQEMRDTSGIMKDLPIAGSTVQLKDVSNVLATTTSTFKGEFNHKKEIKAETDAKIIALKSGQKALANQQRQFTIVGDVTDDEDEELDDVTIELVKDGKTLEIISSNILGLYNLKTRLNESEKYSFKVSKQGYITIEMPIDARDYKTANAKNNIFKPIILVPSGEKKSEEIRMEEIFSGPKTATTTPVIKKEQGTPIAVTGSVKDNEENPVKGAQITITENNNVIGKKTSDENGNYTFTVQSGSDYVATATGKGFFQNDVKINTQGSKVSSMNIEHKMSAIVLNKTIRMDNIYYDYNKITLRYESVNMLDNLVNFMVSNPSLVIELSSHTDERGSDEYNQNLSEGRALNTAKYLFLKGIAQNRVVYKGFGETRPVKRNASTEEEHQLNRRTEFKVIKQ